MDAMEVEDENDPDMDPFDYEVNQIIGKRVVDGVTQYKVWFKGYKKANAEYCDKDQIEAIDAVEEYEAKLAQNREKSKRKRSRFK